jgi:hypothetical protein
MMNSTPWDRNEKMRMHRIDQRFLIEMRRESGRFGLILGRVIIAIVNQHIRFKNWIDK